MTRRQGITVKSLDRLLRVKTKGRRRMFVAQEWRDLPLWMRAMYFNAEERAIKARKSFTLTPREFIDLVIDACGQCQVSGVAFDGSKVRGPFSPSLDRINSLRGYEAGNVRVVCLIANVAMNSWGQEALAYFAQRVEGRRKQLIRSAKI